MGKRDRRSSLKMNRRAAQAKKKEREKKKRANRKTPVAAPAVKKTRAPKARAVWIAMTPMPEEPPWTRKRSPACSPPRCTTVDQTVKAVSGSDFPVRLAARRPGDPAALVAEASRIRAVLGWQPRFADDLRAVVTQALDWERRLSNR